MSQHHAPDRFGVYIHIPFCHHRCDYCSFATWTDRHHVIDQYMNALVTDIRRNVAAGMPSVDTVFVGGGTPTLVPPEALMACLSELPLVPGAEVTVECNPDDVTDAMMATYFDGGVNRISMGVQSMTTHVLASLGRTHNPANVQRAVESVRSSGIPALNLDLIYGAVGETLDDWRYTVQQAVELSPTHVSAYGLTVEPGTPLALEPHRHPDDDDQADKYIIVDDILRSVGLANYEISNWAIPGFECRHNLLYWRQGDYTGFGCAAHSHADGRRWWNVRTPERYIEAVDTNSPTEASGETLDAGTRKREALELSLRTSDGVPVGALDPKTLEGLVEVVGERIVLTQRGRLLGNEVSLRLLP